MRSNYKLLRDLCYALAQEHTPVDVGSAGDYQQSENYYDLLAKVMRLAVWMETGEDPGAPKLFRYFDLEQETESIH